MLLACGTFGIVFVGFFFLRVLPHPHYTAVPTTAGRAGASSNRLHRTKSEEAKYLAQQGQEPGRPSNLVAPPEETEALNQHDVGEEVAEGVNTDTEASSLMSKSTSSSPGDDLEENNIKDHAHRTDIRGLAMLPMIEFWQLFVLMGILTGVGLMTIK